MDEISGLIIKMTEFFSGDPKRIQALYKGAYLCPCYRQGRGA